MSTFILIDADAMSFLVCSLFVAAAFFAMQTLHKDPPYYNWWSVAFAIGGLRYFTTYLVSITSLQITVFILDLLFIVQALLMMQGTLSMQDKKPPAWIMFAVGISLAVWGYIASAMSFSWTLHDTPILIFYATGFLLAGTACVKDTARISIPTSVRIAGSSLLTIMGIFYLIVLFLRPETNLRWIFVSEQTLLIALGVVLIFAIMNKLQGDVHMAGNIDAISGAYTRHYFIKRIDEELKRAQRYKRPFSMALLRIEDFDKLSRTLDKKVNDAILRCYYESIRDALRDVDFTGLTAAGEFAIALPETDVEEARHVAERQLYCSKKLSIPGLDDTSKPEVYITVLKSDARDSAETLYQRAKNIIDEKIDDGVHPLFY